MRYFVTIMLLLLVSLSLTFGATVKGVVKDADTKAPLIGANVVLIGTAKGATTDADGFFMIQDVPNGEYKLEVSYLGYQQYQQTVTVSGDQDVSLDMELAEVTLAGKAVEVVASRAKVRETPVAFSNVEKEEITQTLGSRDIPMVLNTTPGIYASETGGGPGDSRINVRGFDQRNTAVLINGVPVNDMENGWVYWSNWDGLGDVTSSIQVQRGLGASNLAIASVGGTLNILTDPAAQKPGISYKQEFGNAGFLKGTLTLNSGRMSNGFAISAAAVRKIGDGIVDQAWSDAWAYYGAISWAMSSSNTIELYAVGAPQQHGQRSFTKPIEYYDKDYAVEIFRDENLPEESIALAENGQNFGQNFNAHWGPIWDFNPSDLQEYYNDSAHDFSDRTPYLDGSKADFNGARVIMERENYFHKPQFNLNWYWNVSENSLLTSIAYVSLGKGGGTGTFASSRGSVSVRAIPEGKYEGDLNSFTGALDWQAVYNTNNSTLAQNADPDLVAAGKVGADERKAGRILRNSVNNHSWYGLISNLEHRFSKQLKMTLGVDLRYYKGEHWREVRNLVGGDYTLDDNDMSDGNSDHEVNRLGDIIDYHNDGITRWYGGFLQLEGRKDNLTLVASGALSQTGYQRVDYFVDPVAHEAEFGFGKTSDWENFTGGNAKFGANYNASSEWNIYGNVGFISKAPIFDAVFDFSHQLYEQTFNEKTYAAEVGTGYRTTHANTNVNFYYTYWKDRSWSQSIRGASGETTYFLLQGIDARHYGIELEYFYKPTRWLDLRLMGSVGDWTWINDVETTYAPEDDPSNLQTFNVYADGLKVADAAQKTLSIGATFYPVKGLYVNGTLTSFGDYFAQFDPSTRTDPNDRAQPWRVPNYSLVDLHAGYLLPFDVGGKVTFELFGHVFNLFDVQYITDAVDNDAFIGRPTYTSHTAESATVFMGLERRFNLGFNIKL